MSLAMKTTFRDRNRENLVTESILDGVVTTSPYTGITTIEPLNALQELLLESFERPEPSAWVSSRQSGLSTFLCELAVNQITHGNGNIQKVLIIAENQPALSNLQSMITTILEFRYPYASLTTNEKNYIELIDGSSIEFVSSSQKLPGLLDGREWTKYSLVLMDNSSYSYCENSFFPNLFHVLYPRISTGKTKLVIASTGLGGINKDFTRAVLTRKYKTIDFDVVRLSANDIAFLEGRESDDKIFKMREYISEDRYFEEYLVQPRID